MKNKGSKGNQTTISLFFLSAFIGYAYSYNKNIYFYNASECAGDIDIGSNRDDLFWGYGYKSLLQSTSPNSYSRYCYGALSCKETPYIYTNYLGCKGTSSCSNSGYMRPIYADSIYGDGANSLINTNISITMCYHQYKFQKCRLTCNGDKSFAHSTISIPGEWGYLSAKGALSLLAATINIISGTFDAYFYGYYAGYQATIHCKAGSVCNIHCYYNGCGGLSLICHDNAQCNIINEGNCSLSPNTNLELDAKEILFWNSTQITATNEDQCSKQITDKTFDNYRENENGEHIYTTNVGPICCRAAYACSGSLISYDSNEASVVCSGVSSCSDAEIISNSTDLMVECSADYACSHGSIAANGGTVYCYGYMSCRFTTITKIGCIYCTGSESCYDADITSSGIDITVYFTGYHSAWNTLITCNENDHCIILCDAYQACANVSLYCYGTCYVECNQDTGCPNVWSANPTPNPKQNNTKTVTIIAVAVCAFLGLFFFFCVMICMNKRRIAAAEEGAEGKQSVEMNKKKGPYKIISNKAANCNTLDEGKENLNEEEIGTDNVILTKLPMAASNNYDYNKLQVEGK